MVRRRHEEEHENHERWMVSYADFVTLLFAFFVVMYAISSVNEGKYRVLSNSMLQAFRSISNQPGATIVSPPQTVGAIIAPIISPLPKANPEEEAKRAAYRQRMRDMAEEIKRVLAPLVKGGQVRITEGIHGIAIEINASALFATGEAELGPAATRALKAVAEVVSQGGFPIKVEGHTDTQPINTAMFPSNWELSAVRASSVVRLFIEAGVAPSRLTAAGYADQRPVADNSTEEGRARNRRVTILIESMLPEQENAPSVTTEVGTDASMRTVDGALGTPENIRLVPKQSASAP